MENDPQLILLQKWAPQVYFHPGAQYFPCSVDWYLMRTQLLDGTSNTFSDHQTGLYNPVINNTTRRDSSFLADPALGQRTQFTLSIRSTRGGRDPPSEKCERNVRTS
jgi:hypothetical protein